MSSNKVLVWIIAASVAALVVFNTFYIVKEYERAVVLRFGALVETDVPPGLHVKIPFADKVRTFDGRTLTTDARPESFYTVENKRLIVDSYAKWRIQDVAKYYKATGGQEIVADNRLSTRIADGLRNQVGRRTLHEVVSGERDALMSEITSDLNSAVQESLGVEVIDVRVKRIDLPDDVSESVFDRMAAEREEEAREYRATGREQAEVIRASADREVTVILANAYRDAEKVRGEGDAKATNIYAQVFSRNPEFYTFLRSLEAYRSAFGQQDDLLVVDPSSDFFRYLKNSEGRK
ncbi:protease modulator HflC [Marinimicrobium agarilyticum]|uniref:protease modulator HflC n=1 Tax=Marinimicrobium agarilyticum TaxID=306546 RepID=UPI000425D855|nr:protease modulator HflC [Marinimicrobium agarilyticum]